MRLRGVVCAAVLAAIPTSTPLHAEDFPARPITWIVPYAPGGITDTNSRLVAEEMSRVLGQPVVVDNRAGGGGIVGTEQAARARADGYTMIYVTQGTIAANVSLKKSLSYDPLTSFVPVRLIAQTPNLFVARQDAPFSTVKDLVAYAKANPGKLSFASSGVGTATHLVSELFKTVAGIEMLHVPYKGSAPAINDLIAGRIDVMFDYQVSAGPHVEAGKLKPLAVTSPERMSAVPGVPTMIEAGFPGVTTESWSGIMVPAGTPPEIVDKLAAAAKVAVVSERVRAYNDKFGSRTIDREKGAMTAYIKEEIDRWADVIARAGIEKQ